MLSCSCPEWEGGPGTWSFYAPEYFIPFVAARRKRCCSCRNLIDIGADCLEFPRVRAAYTEIEERISGEEIEMSSLFMCEKCGENYLNLEAVGYCFAPTDDMRDCLKEYHELTGFTPSSGEK